jgi:MmyB-like transcription regulator ligand binding domain
MISRTHIVPGSAVDRHWNLVATNAALAPMLAGVADRALLEPPVNVLRLSLHPEGLAPRIANLVEWRAHLLDRLRRQIAVTSDPVLADLLRELSTYPVNNTLAAIDAAPPDRPRGRARTARAGNRRWSPVIHLHHHGVWYAARHHPLGASAGSILPSERRNGRDPAAA